MNLVNGSGMAAGYTMGLDRTGAEYLVVAVKGTFILPRQNEVPTLAPEQVDLVDADQFSGEPGHSATLVECDYALNKPLCDVLLNGSAYTSGGRPAERIGVGLRLGALEKRFAVVGDRVWRARAGLITADAPMPFTSMPISYDRAFGGVDNFTADAALHRAYLPNPIGRGWHRLTDDALVDGTPLPNTEEINDPVREPGGKYRPMAFGPVGRGWPSRIHYAGTYDQAWRDNEFPFLPQDFDVRYFQCAPQDQQMPPPQSTERVLLVNLTPDGRRDFPFPAVDMPIVFFRRRAERVETKGTIDTVLFEPDMERFSVVWRASLKLQRDIFEVSRVVIGHMSRAWWRAVETGKSYKRSLDVVVREKAPQREAI
jgi:hypothetical protein